MTNIIPFPNAQNGPVADRWMRLSRARAAYIEAKAVCDRTRVFADGVAAAHAFQEFAGALRACGIEPTDAHATHPALVSAGEIAFSTLAGARSRQGGDCR